MMTDGKRKAVPFGAFAVQAAAAALATAKLGDELERMGDAIKTGPDEYIIPPHLLDARYVPEPLEQRPKRKFKHNRRG